MTIKKGDYEIIDFYISFKKGEFQWDTLKIINQEPLKINQVSLYIQTGIRKYTCTSCKKTYEEKLPKLPAPTERELIEQFVSRMYTKALNRAAEEAGKTYWSDELEKQNTDGANVAFGFIFSEEFKNNNLNDEEFVNVMYATFFDRAADEGRDTSFNSSSGWPFLNKAVRGSGSKLFDRGSLYGWR